MKRIIGVLSLQGGFTSHKIVLESFGAEVREIRTPEQLSLCDGLVIPGGESTVMTKLMRESKSDFYAAIKEFSKKYPVMGTCAGIILLARPGNDERVVSLDILPVTVERNSYGRQTESFIEKIPLSYSGSNDILYPATFIRAPRISSVEQNVRILAHTKKDPVMVQFENILGLTFHPELTPHDKRIHAYFLSL